MEAVKYQRKDSNIEPIEEEATTSKTTTTNETANANANASVDDYDPDPDYEPETETEQNASAKASAPKIMPTPSPPWFTPIKRKGKEKHNENFMLNQQQAHGTQEETGAVEHCSSSSSSDSLTNVSSMLERKSVLTCRRRLNLKQMACADFGDVVLRPINFDDHFDSALELKCNEMISCGAPRISSSNVSTPQAQSSSASTNASTTPSSARISSSSNSISSAMAIKAMETITTATTTTKENCAQQSTQLLHWKDMPAYLQFNPYVLHGYRPLQPFKGCLLSLFHWHNETVNIFTHAIPIVYILAVVPGLMPWSKGYRFLSFCHLLGSVAPWCGSFLYHLFMNIQDGERIYYTLLKLDMLGIWVSQSFGALPLITATTFCFSPFLKWFIILAYCALSLWGLYKALTAKSPWGRRMCFLLPFTMRSILTYLRVKGLVGGSHMALSHVYLQLEVATIKDFEWMSTATCDAVTIDGALAATLPEHSNEL